MWDLTIHPLRGPTSSSAHFLAGIGSDTKLSHPGPDPPPLHDIVHFGPRLRLTVLFLGTHTRTSQWVTHHGSALARYSLNFGVPTEPEANELPKGLTLGRDGNIHIRITPLGDVGSHNPPPLRPDVLVGTFPSRLRL